VRGSSWHRSWPGFGVVGALGALIDTTKWLRYSPAPYPLYGIDRSCMTDGGFLELRRCVCELRLPGLRLVPWSGGSHPMTAVTIRSTPSVSSFKFRSACKWITQSSLALGNRAVRSLFGERLLEFPELYIVAGHIGAPWTQNDFSATKFPKSISIPRYKATRFPPDFTSSCASCARKVMFGRTIQCYGSRLSRRSGID